jgi:hypothetical protein
MATSMLHARHHAAHAVELCASIPYARCKCLTRLAELTPQKTPQRPQRPQRHPKDLTPQKTPQRHPVLSTKLTCLRCCTCMLQGPTNWLLQLRHVLLIACSRGPLPLQVALRVALPVHAAAATPPTPVVSQGAGVAVHYEVVPTSHARGVQGMLISNTSAGSASDASDAGGALLLQRSLSDSCWQQQLSIRTCF